MGHAGLQKLRSMQKKGLIVGIKCVIKDGWECLCEACLRGKQARVPVSRLPAVHRGCRPTRIGKVTHIDLCYCDRPTFGGHHYTLICTETTSRERMGYVLPSKAGALEAYKEYTAFMETQ
ncbi:unnamed protein product, partial [Heterosigma akashiwo]